MSFIKYIADENHYKIASKREQSDACIDSAEREQFRPKVKEVLSLVGKAKQTVHFLPFGLRRIPVWRGSSNIQTL